MELKNIRKGFSDEEEVLKGISLSIGKGEFITLLGSSGCGKTTTLRIIAGLEQPDAGQVFLDGRDVTSLNPEDRDVNTVFQNYALFPHMNVADNIGYGLKLKKIPKTEIRRKVTEMLELVQLPGYEKRKPSELSGGQKQRVAIARALINNPQVLLLDEPLGALDLQLRRAMQAELKRLQKKLGITFIYITHDQEEAINMSDRIAVMNLSLIHISHRIQAPVCDSLMGKGGFSGEDPYYTGMLGMHGTKTSNLGVSQCDLLIVLGARFSDRVTGNVKTFANKAKILQVDIDAAEINKNVLVDAYIEGDVKEVLRRLLEEIPEKKHPKWMEHIQEMKARYPLNYDHTQLTGPYVIEKLYELTGGDAIITTDVGQHQMWAAQYYKYKEPRTFLTSGGLGTMGYGLGAAIGAKMGRPDKTVVNIAGDGCFRMNMNEIATAVRCGKPLVQIVLNNHVLGMVRQWQTLFYDHRYSHTVLNDAVDFVKISEGMGAKAIRVTKMEEVEPALKEALASDGPVVLDCWIDQDLSVFPMVPAGASIDDVFDEEDMKK